MIYLDIHHVQGDFCCSGSLTVTVAYIDRDSGFTKTDRGGVLCEIVNHGRRSFKYGQRIITCVVVNAFGVHDKSR